MPERQNTRKETTATKKKPKPKKELLSKVAGFLFYNNPSCTPTCQYVRMHPENLMIVDQKLIFFAKGGHKNQIESAKTAQFQSKIAPVKPLALCDIERRSSSALETIEIFFEARTSFSHNSSRLSVGWNH